MPVSDGFGNRRVWFRWKDEKGLMRWFSFCLGRVRDGNGVNWREAMYCFCCWGGSEGSDYVVVVERIRFCLCFSLWNFGDWCRKTSRACVQWPQPMSRPIHMPRESDGLIQRCRVCKFRTKLWPLKFFSDFSIFDENKRQIEITFKKSINKSKFIFIIIFISLIKFIKFIPKLIFQVVYWPWLPLCTL